MKTKRALFTAFAASLGCLLATAAPPSAEAATEAAGPHWHDRLEPALAAAAESHRYVLVDLYADWCGWCKRLDKEVFSTPAFADFARDFVLLRVDVEDGGEGTWLQGRLGVTTLPTLALVDSELARVGTVRGFKPQPLMSMALRRAVTSYERARRQAEAQLASEDPEEVMEAAEALRGLQAGAEAAAAYRRALELNPPPPVQQVRVAAAVVDSLRLARDYPAAHAELERARRLLAAAAGGKRARAAEMLDVAALRLAEDLSECQRLAALESFVRDRSASPLAGQARSRLHDLKTDSDESCS
jgi:thioredoxin-like negative regulator of GroEL